ncbi:hypothetical protein Ssi03_12120 [Sphaerisporangium siamense]|uniref:Uncharacterized protein n=1 Tax=Sphaerisporangium siamense TaxID=795645 RepID=A0A7W7GDG9_9ACTN|nr:DUF5691 domain-containing protein [Sphaerisporangium siamense]MBB4703016.1 hypothetical protein [Sphaerisporangium siamense]GII83222.1 hypothetical protein Ssi03_12120 [Sphaerisporangium siamense]
MITTDDWERLVSAALVGTDRRPQPGLLGQAAARTVGARAGQRLQRGEPLPAAPAEEQPPVPRAAADRLARILGGEQSRLLPEWLEAAGALGYRLPAKLLPPVLDHGARDRSLRPSIGVLAGARGRWLATLNDTWKYVLEEATRHAGTPTRPGMAHPQGPQSPTPVTDRPTSTTTDTTPTPGRALAEPGDTPTSAANGTPASGAEDAPGAARASADAGGALTGGTDTEGGEAGTSSGEAVTMDGEAADREAVAAAGESAPQERKATPEHHETRAEQHETRAEQHETRAEGHETRAEGHEAAVEGDEVVVGHPLWEFGTRGDRLSFFRELRADDPVKARALLLRGWDKETPEDRAAFVHALADGLTMADEPFLEAALDDRRREVRAQAADLLTRLPQSRLGLRMTARAALCLRVTGDRLHAEPPAACDAAMERDGIRSRAPAGTGQRSWWLQQVIAHTPLSFWTGHFGLPAKQLVALNIGEWAREIRLGWERAAVLQNDAEWARALFAVEPLSDLLAVLPPAERADKAAELVHDQPVDGQLIMMLGGLPAPWGAALAQAVLEKIIATAGHQPWNLEELVRLAGERVDPAMYEMAARLSDERPVQEVAATLHFRHQMHAELRP